MEETWDLPFLDAPPSPRFERRTVTIAPGEHRPHDDAEWRDCLVTVTAGAVVVVGRAGTRWTFSAGDVLWLVGLPVAELHNPGRRAATLVAVCRRRPPAGFSTRSVLGG